LPQVSRLARSGTKASTIGRWRRNPARVFEQGSLDAADQIGSVLGNMKGAAMKLGQMMSVIDLSIVPEHARADFQRKLAALRDQAPAGSFAQMRPRRPEEPRSPRGSEGYSLPNQRLG
jgi:predicted unusual protein kinase regulating ubiquinone biosynthesis (AarF/ABC1/UbiB family)